MSAEFSADGTSITVEAIAGFGGAHPSDRYVTSWTSGGWVVPRTAPVRTP